MDYHIEKVASAKAEVGEGPVWNPDEKKVYWTDIAGGRLFKYDPETGSNKTIHNGVSVGGYRFNEGGGLVLGTWEVMMLLQVPMEVFMAEQIGLAGKMMLFSD